MLRRHVLIYAVLALAIPAVSPAATWKGRSVDGPRFNASIVHDDFGAISNVDVKFNGHDVTVYLRGSSQLNLVLDEEEIADPRHIMARDHRRGIQWEINVRNLREAAPKRSGGPGIPGIPGHRLAPMRF